VKKRLSKKTLAEALGVSAAAASRYFARGCPSDSVQAALDWQRRHVDPTQRTLRHAGRMPAADPIADVTRLMALAAADFAGHADQLRAAMRAVPQHARPDLLLNLDVMRRLLPAGVVAELGGAACDTPGDGGGPDDEAEHVAAVLYALAAGELLWT